MWISIWHLKLQAKVEQAFLPVLFRMDRREALLRLITGQTGVFVPNQPLSERETIGSLSRKPMCLQHAFAVARHIVHPGSVIQNRDPKS